VSASLLPEFSRESDIPTEAFLLWLLFAQVLVELNPQAEFHTQDRNCLFDENSDFDSLKRSIVEPTIEPSCLKRLRPKYRDASAAIVATIAKYRRRQDGNLRSAAPHISQVSPGSGRAGVDSV
jgi:hypothetical protein